MTNTKYFFLYSSSQGLGFSNFYGSPVVLVILVIKMLYGDIHDCAGLFALIKMHELRVRTYVDSRG